MDLDEIRKLVIVAVFSDDLLMEKLVLKGGLALSLVHEISDRASIDVDFSMEAEFDDVDDASSRMQLAVSSTFAARGYEVFDFRFQQKPPEPRERWWGGYRIEFKMINLAGFQKYSKDPAKMRIAAHPMAASGSTRFRIDVSKYEYCDGGRETELGDSTIRVYTLEMIVLEKLRAICQQNDQSIPPVNKSSRARDFFDIYQVLIRRDFRLGSPENMELARAIFEAKRVPLSLLRKISESRSFHAESWPMVVDSVPGVIEEFDFYFDFVVAEVAKLEPLWDE